MGLSLAARGRRCNPLSQPEREIRGGVPGSIRTGVGLGDVEGRRGGAPAPHFSLARHPKRPSPNVESSIPDLVVTKADLPRLAATDRAPESNQMGAFVRLSFTSRKNRDHFLLPRDRGARLWVGLGVEEQG